jgi:hypothetical protein
MESSPVAFRIGPSPRLAEDLLDMKAPPNMRSLLATLFVLLALAGCSRKSGNPHYDMLLRAQSDALEAKIVLTELRDGRTSNALELLEQQIDISIITIDASLSKVSGPERDTALGTLRSLKAYWATHPRQREAVIPDEMTIEEKASIEEMTRKASGILGDLK